MNEISPNQSAAAALIGDPANFGRVAEDGTVYVRTPDGEKAVGSYPGKSPEEALGYFVRKFEALASEVALLAARVRSGAMVPQDATIAVNRLRTNVKELNGVGDLQALATAVEQIIPAIEDGRGAYEAKKLAEKALKAAQRETALAVKEKIVAEAQSLALSESWKTTGDRLKVLLDEWKVAPRLDKKTDAEMWKKFSSSRNKFDKRRRTHFATLDAAQNKVAEAKNAIVTEAESLATSKDWVATARRFKALMDLWKASGRGKKNEDAKLWARFKIAQDQFFASKNADLEKREGSMKANLEKRDALITQIEALLPISNAETASKAFREFARQWDKIGMTQREKRVALDTRFAAVETQIKAAQEVQWRKTDPVAKSRANDVVRQLEEAVANYEKQAEKAQASGNAKKAAEALAAVEARRQWLADAVKGLEEFTS
ncbi:unannotated protein [freshwater metagenome]|uniref:Unannotated protein n=1 Tax=freshwater metagenome TaxID=449393 RepID=A0A6J7MFD8_9ZZZZ|nr:DUF349 domain-containing protein [Actinomycetota bacterium]MSW22978.1 DUF349 domain-containing protein [Actinomycetota bacterium]MSW75382.1 DUF349 domain-containing protein [Actinomycetota bacterium]MSY30588.1 DUF349 domain-containing protein [Actinomycetota bacterium]